MLCQFSTIHSRYSPLTDDLPSVASVSTWSVASAAAPVVVPAAVPVAAPVAVKVMPLPSRYVTVVSSFYTRYLYLPLVTADEHPSFRRRQRYQQNVRSPGH